MEDKVKYLRIAILSNELLGWGSGKNLFQAILNNYTWRIHDETYRFKTDMITDKEILNGNLLVSNYDVLLVPGGGVGDGHALIKGFTIFRNVKKWKNKIAQYIKDGGGYVGICGGTALITNLKTDNDKFPRTFLERLYDKSAIGVSTISSYYKHLALPLFYLFQNTHPEKIGAASYVFSFSPGKTIDGRYLLSGGVPVDCILEKDNPIFANSPQHIQRMRWWGGPALLIPNKPDRDIKILARYPAEDISSNEFTMIHAWRYIGGITGLLKGFLKSLFFVKRHQMHLTKVLLYTYYFAGDWEKTNKIIDLNYSNKACMTSEIYPNENKGRIILCTTHPEYIVWWDGRIQEIDDDFHCIANGFHQWIDISLQTHSEELYLTCNWWIVRRIIAWAAKTPDDQLPPMYDNYLPDEAIKIVKKDLFWNGTIEHQIENI